MEQSTHAGTLRFALVLAMALLIIAPVAHAQAQDISPTAPATVLPPTVEGDWVRTDTHHSGSWDGLTKNYPKAQLTEEGKELLAKLPQRHILDQRAANGAVIVYDQPCIFNGGQTTLEPDSSGFHAVIDKKEVIMVQDSPRDRHIYLDGRSLPAPGTRSPSPSGYSVGHIEADGTLVVTTTDLTPGPVTAGGVREPETVVTQKYIPSADGKHLLLVMTWTDPKLYVAPHTYEYTFDRMAPGAYALDDFCDATDPLWRQSVVPPAQN